MAKKKAESRKRKPAASSKVKSPGKGLSKRPASQSPEAKSGGMRLAKNYDTRSTQAAPETEEVSSAIMPESKPAPRHVVDSETEGGVDVDVHVDVDVNARVEVATPDPRLPQVPTTLVRRNRNGAVQCECRVGPDGIFYNGRRYGSLSGAASAASKDLGLNPVVNGYVFFHLTKPGRARLSEVDRLSRIGNRYEARVAALLMARSGDTLYVEVKDAIEGHTQRLQKILTMTAK